MKLVSFQLNTPLGIQVRVGAIDTDGRIVDLELGYRLSLIGSGVAESAAKRISSAVIPSSMVAFIEGAGTSLAAAEQAISWSQYDAPSEVQVHFASHEITLLPPVPEPPLLRDFMAFESHLKNIYPKLGREIPEEWYQLPVYYKGNPSALGAHEQDVAMPSYEDELDFEFELGFVISNRCKNVKPEEAMDHIYGMMIYNDFSARGIQAREMSVGLGPAKGKDFVGGHVFGPCLVTSDEIPDFYNLNMVARVNGEVWCNDNSGSMHWKLGDMLAHASRDEWVRPGEIFGSGTVGWGSAAERGVALKRGDVVELEVERLGTLRNRVV